jgi:hypothetical protein
MSNFDEIRRTILSLFHMYRGKDGVSELNGRLKYILQT